jgi:hypothetical protein
LNNRATVRKRAHVYKTENKMAKGIIIDRERVTKVIDEERVN